MAADNSKTHIDQATGVETYGRAARSFHWLTVLLILLQAPIGLYMVYRGNTLKIWDDLTNTLYSSHKLIGVTILTVIVLRLLWRLTHGAPGHEPTIEPWQKVTSTIVHWSLYALLLIVPVLGYLGVAYYPALKIFGVIQLPALVSPDKAYAKEVFEMHGTAACILIALIGLHIAAALYHHLKRGDNVLARMLPGLARRK